MGGGGEGGDSGEETEIRNKGYGVEFRSKRLGAKGGGGRGQKEEMRSETKQNNKLRENGGKVSRRRRRCRPLSIVLSDFTWMEHGAVPAGGREGRCFEGRDGDNK